MNSFQNYLESKVERPKAFLESNHDTGELFIYDEIGYFGILAEDVAVALKTIDPTQKITVHINSPGGSVPDGLAITNLLRGRGNVDVVIDGWAVSIATVIAMAGDTVRIADNAVFMIHNPTTITMGEAEDMRSAADVLDKMKSQIIKTYQRRSKLPEDRLAELMNAETWFTAEEALDNGFVDEVFSPGEDNEEALNRFDLSIYRNCPDRLRGNGTAQPQSGGGDASALRRYHFNRRHEINLTSL